MKVNRSKKESILIIDDIADMLELQRLILEMEGYEVLTAFTISEAFDFLCTGHHIDLILLDFKLQNSTGSDFIQLIERKRPEVLKTMPVVFYSGVDDIPESKASGFISKLTNIDDFLVQIKSYIHTGHSSSYRY